ncbi:hypothetical protein SSX86_016893 [Deinandra increscens subsp. villosa]|uniref:RRM domain-containing protein n=1 Tax=Deinandra increscens subsp. villosa TaxID=3103831 RepID=A0AAP0D1C0_9ASTR
MQSNAGKDAGSGKQSFHDNDLDEWMFPKRKHRSQPSSKNMIPDRKERLHTNPNYHDLKKVSTSVFITNFPPDTSTQELWKYYDQWGRVSDVYISSRRTKLGRKFGFVRFVGVKDIKKLIINLRTIWIGSYHVFADEVRENIKPRESAPPIIPIRENHVHDETNVASKVVKSFADLLKPIINSQKEETTKQTLKKRVSISLDDCIEAKSSNFHMGKVTDPLCIPNLPTLFVKEGFHEVRFRYIGGRWVGLSFPNVNLALKFDACTVLKNCFSELQILSNSFIPDEKCVWLDIVGLPVVASTPAVLKRIGELWGEFMFFGNDKDEPLANGKVCIITKCSNNIDESIVVDVGSFSFDVKVKEFEKWVPSLRFHEDSSSSEDDSEEEGDFEDGEINANEEFKGEN